MPQNKSKNDTEQSGVGLKTQRWQQLLEKHFEWHKYTIHTCECCDARHSCHQSQQFVKFNWDVNNSVSNDSCKSN